MRSFLERRRRDDHTEVGADVPRNRFLQDVGGHDHHLGGSRLAQKIEQETPGEVNQAP